MNKRIFIPAFGAALALALVVAYMAHTATPVSARTIIDRAYAAQSVKDAAQGIRHSRVEAYENQEALPAGQGLDTISDTYFELQTFQSRSTVTDAKSGKPLYAFGTDNTYDYTYSPEQDGKFDSSNDFLTVYRTASPYKPGQKFPVPDEMQQAKHMFDVLTNSPDFKLVGQQTLPDGRAVYVLSAQQLVNISEQDNPQALDGTLTLMLDTNTYELVQSRISIQKDGQEVVISSRNVLADEILPADTHVAWNLSDLPNGKLVDDPQNLYGDQMALPISLKQLAAFTHSAYMLKSVPTGYTLEVAQLVDPSGPTTYNVMYNSLAGDAFELSPCGGLWCDTQDNTGTYTTAGKLKVVFLPNHFTLPSLAGGKPFSQAVLETAQGHPLIYITTTLPRETVQAWAENLVPVK